MNRNELNGLMQGPKSRRPSTRTLMMYASGPNDLGELHAVIAGARLR